MKKVRVLAVCLLVMLLCMQTGAFALEGVYKDVCPLNIRPAVLPETGEGEEKKAAELSLSVFNATEHPIDYIEFSLYLFDADGNPAKNGETHFFRAYAPGIGLAPYTERKITWSLEGFSSPAEYRDFRMEKVIFTEGTEWLAPKKLYDFAYMYAENPMTKDGAYLLDADRALTLVDYSYSSAKRTWYIWNDGPGWVPFSNDLVAKCQIWQPGASIKLVINENEDLYAMESFRVALSPGSIGVCAYETGASKTVMPTGKDSEEICFTLDSLLPIGDVPANIALWDYTECEDRAWSIWDGEEWVTFSYDRGPLCQIWQTGVSYIRLSYPDAEAIYAVEIQSAEVEDEERVHEG